MKLLLIVCFFVLISSVSVSGFGVTPAQQIISYTPGEEHKLSFDIINFEGKKVQLIALPQGELNQSLKLSNFSFIFEPTTASQSVSYSFKTPGGLAPGKHSADILVIEIPDTSQSGENYIGSVVGIITKVVVDVPYPGKYVESSLSVSSAKEGGIAFVFPIVSKGDLDIARAKAVIEIFTPLNEKVASLITNEIPVPSHERRELAVIWDTSSVKSGKYRAVATVLYDESTISLEREFAVGADTLKINNVEVNDFALGGIAKFEFLAENPMNIPMQGVYITMQIFNEQEAILAEFKSATYDIDAFDKKVLVAFWDTEGVKKGSYPAKAIIKFGEQSLQHELTLEVSDDEINVVGLGYVIKSAGGKSSNNLVTLLGVIVGILVILNLVWFLMLRKKVNSSHK
ncbi:hypothetical protein EXS72_01395 [Candidatus Pacearchaeota archaeon]|nr:hypothetical protein [Candidatus Pacearchaeota archaeon]